MLTLNKDTIIKLKEERGWSLCEFSRKSGISKAQMSKWISGKSNAGRKLITGIIRAFPDESIDKLFIQ